MMITVSFVFVQIMRWIDPKACDPSQYGLGNVIDHYLVHTGGRGIIDEVESQLKLSPDQVAAARQTLHKFGNTSAASTWWVIPSLAFCSSP